MRPVGWLVVFVFGLALGFAFSTHQVTRADPVAPAADEPAAQEAETVRQLQEIRTQLQDLRALLCSGRVRVTVLVNPPED